MQNERPKVGIGCVVIKDGKVLLGERLFGHGAGNWMIPGGHLELGESFEKCALREAEEESGLKNLKVIGVCSLWNEIAYEKHYVNIGVLLEWTEREPFSAEPEKSGNWHWHDVHDLPENMFLASRKCIENWQKGGIYNEKYEI
jgi:8-oxo-dGTP diphosphatase